MKTIDHRLQKLERSLALRVGNGDDWGSLASVRDEIVCHAERLSDSYGAAIRVELDTLGPAGLWCETTRTILADHGFAQSGDESFAETMARVLDIGTDQLRILIAQGQIASALLESLGEVR
jgi:hypothetical protein